jgi:hypothetical protein
VHAAELDVEPRTIVRSIEDELGELFDDRLDLRDRGRPGPALGGSTVSRASALRTSVAALRWRSPMPSSPSAESTSSSDDVLCTYQRL